MEDKVYAVASAFARFIEMADGNEEEKSNFDITEETELDFQL